ncbi:MAG TPA: 50S ribosomal protein L6 [Candidatus Lokiarchaeia archaeon]|nr:50S ribosomal protein L6 [Candidatus Lokiarchaeia archaeon]
MPKFAYAEEVLDIPDNVDVTMDGKKVTVKGPKGTITKDYTHARVVTLTMQDKKITCSIFFPKKQERSMLRTVIGHIENQILGVTEGFTYKAKIVYAHFPMSVEVQGQAILVKNFIGERGSRVTHKAGDVDVKVTKEDVIISGIDKDAVAQTAANLKLICKIKKKDPRIFQDGIYVYEKLVGAKVSWEIKV